MRFTIERLRTVLLIAGTLLVVALGFFLARGTWRNPFKNRDIPKRLGIDIQQEANGFTYTQTHGGRTLFKIHASKVVQLKNDHALLHDVMIELYGTDGSRVDRIEGSEFQYDQKAQIATAQGAVEITMMKPGTKPAVAIKPGPSSSPAANTTNKPAPSNTQSGPAVSTGEIHVKTSGLVFYQKTGIASTDQRVDFAITQGSGSALGATYNSDDGHLVLDRQVALNLRRNNEPVEIHAEHAEFDRDAQICNLGAATASYRKGNATAGAARILFRDDGSAQHLDASNGFTLATATGGHLAAPTGWLEFNEKNQPQRGHLEGGVTMDAASDTARGSRQSHGSAPSAELEFTSQGELQHAHLERGVELTSSQQGDSRQGPLTVKRTWRSPVADIDFRDAGKGQVEPATMHGTGGVTITGESRRGSGPVLPSRLAADDLKVDFGPNSSLSDLTGIGHASLEETSGSGAHQTSSGDRLQAHFVPVEQRSDAGEQKPAKPTGTSSSGAAQIESATLEGNVALSQQPAAKAGEPAAAPMRATAGRADYGGSGEWIHLTQTPRVNDGSVQLSSDKVDLSQVSGDAFARDNVKATSFGGTADSAADPSRKNASNRADKAGIGLGGQGPSHVVADEAEMRKSTGESVFRGHARLWQEANSVAAPVIVLNRQRQTLLATSTSAADPVRVVMLSADMAAPGQRQGRESTEADRAKPRSPSVIRMSGGALKYSDAERKALMTAGSAGTVIADTPTARTTSDQVELVLLPPGNHAGRDGGSAQVDTMTASGHVVVSSGSRRGTGMQLVYTGDTGEYVLTGTAATPPKMIDPARGTVTGDALIFHSRDDSVSIEGGTAKTATETHAPKGKGDQ